MCLPTYIMFLSLIFVYLHSCTNSRYHVISNSFICIETIEVKLSPFVILQWTENSLRSLGPRTQNSLSGVWVYNFFFNIRLVPIKPPPVLFRITLCLRFLKCILLYSFNTVTPIYPLPRTSWQILNNAGSDEQNFSEPFRRNQIKFSLITKRMSIGDWFLMRDYFKFGLIKLSGATCFTYLYILCSMHSWQC